MTAADEEDAAALERVDVLVREYLCCDDARLTESARRLKEEIRRRLLAWSDAVEKFRKDRNPPGGSGEKF